MKVFVTGIGGFVGGHLTRELVAHGHDVCGSYLGTGPHLVDDVPELWGVDITEADSLTAALTEAAPDAVVHLAGWSHVGSSWSHLPECFSANVLGTEHLLAAAAAAGVPGRRVIVASSAEVYGLVPEDEQPIAETHTLSPASPYALTKAAAERLALAAGAIVVRSFNAVGPGQSPHFALPAFTRQLAAIERGEQEPVLRVGNLEARRDFLHVGDAVAGYRTLLEDAGPEKDEAGTVYNLASGQVVSIEEALHRLIARSGQQVRVEVDPERVRPVDIPLLQGDASRLRALGWQPRRDLDQALEELWQAR